MQNRNPSQNAKLGFVCFVSLSGPIYFLLYLKTEYFEVCKGVGGFWFFSVICFFAGAKFLTKEKCILLEELGIGKEKNTSIVTSLCARGKHRPLTPYTVSILTLFAFKTRFATALPSFISTFQAIRACCIAIARAATRRFVGTCCLCCSSDVVICFALVGDGYSWVQIFASCTLNID